VKLLASIFLFMGVLRIMVRLAFQWGIDSIG